MLGIKEGKSRLSDYKLLLKILQWIWGKANVQC